MNRKRLALALATAAALALAAIGLETAHAQETGTITGTVTAFPARDLRNTFVYLVKVPGRYAHKTHTMDQRGLKFVPHLMAITVGDTVRFVNDDHVDHNVFSPDHETYNLGTWGFGQSRSYTFHHLGGYTQLCAIHPSMLGYVFVNQNPYATGVNADGTYTIKDVPPGTWKIAVWNPDLKAPEQDVTVTGGGTSKVDFSIGR